MQRVHSNGVRGIQEHKGCETREQDMGTRGAWLCKTWGKGVQDIDMRMQDKCKVCKRCKGLKGVQDNGARGSKGARQGPKTWVQGCKS